MHNVRGTVSIFREDGRQSIIDIALCIQLLIEDMEYKVSEKYSSILRAIPKEFPEKILENIENFVKEC